MKRATPESWTDNSPVPERKSIPTPDFPTRPGVAAAGTAILIMVSLFCIFQYWLLTATLEAYHAGDFGLPLGAFFASLACFVLAVALTITNEVALMRQQDFLRVTRTGRAASSTIRAEETHPEPFRGRDVTAEHVRATGSPAAGGDAG